MAKSGAKKDEKREPEIYRAGEAPYETGKGRGKDPEDAGPDVFLDVPKLTVEEIDLEVDNLRAKVTLQAEVLDFVRLNVGADVSLGKVHLTIKGVEAVAQLEVRLDNVEQIIERVLATIDRNPEILEQIATRVGSAAERIGSGAGGAAEEIGSGAGGAAEEIGSGAGEAVEKVGKDAGAATDSVGRAAKSVSKSAGKVTEAAGTAAKSVSKGASKATAARKSTKAVHQSTGKGKKAPSKNTAKTAKPANKGGRSKK